MFLSIVRKYTRAKKLTHRMLNELVNHIEECMLPTNLLKMSSKKASVLIGHQIL